MWALTGSQNFGGRWAPAAMGAWLTLKKHTPAPYPPCVLPHEIWSLYAKLFGRR